MATATVDLELLKDAVLQKLEDSPQRPTELLANLGDDYPDVAIKEAVLHLLQEGRIEFTSDRQLHLAAAA